MDEVLHVKLGISTNFTFGTLSQVILSIIFTHLNVPVLLPIGVCICKLSFILLHCADRFIYRVGTEVTVSVLFSQAHKKC